MAQPLHLHRPVPSCEVGVTTPPSGAVVMMSPLSTTPGTGSALTPLTCEHRQSLTPTVSVALQGSLSIAEEDDGPPPVCRAQGGSW